MSRLVYTLIALFFTAQANASFGTTTCASPDSKITYNYRFIWSDPVDINVWTVNGQDYFPTEHYPAGKSFNDSEPLPPTITEERQGNSQTLESSSTTMTSSSIYTYKTKLTFLNEKGESTSLETWLVCSSASGI